MAQRSTEAVDGLQKLVTKGGVNNAIVATSAQESNRQERSPESILRALCYLEAMLLVDPFQNPFSTASTRWDELRHFKSLAA
jgi:hypothetical protein